jgi:hypothetical protein
METPSNSNTVGNQYVGQGYGGFGVMSQGTPTSSATGFAVEMDIFNSGPCDPGNGNHAGIDFLGNCASGSNSGIPLPVVTSSQDLFAQSIGDIADGTTRTVVIQIVSGVVSVAVDGIPVVDLQGVDLHASGYVTGTPYYIGWGGGTGSDDGSGPQASRAEISNVSIVLGGNECL